MPTLSAPSWPLTPLHNPRPKALRPLPAHLGDEAASPPTPTLSPLASSPGTGGLQDHGQHLASACPQPSCLPAGAQPGRLPRCLCSRHTGRRGPNEGCPPVPDLQVSTAGRKAEGEKRPLSEKRVPQGTSGGGGGSGPQAARGPGKPAWLAATAPLCASVCTSPHLSGSQRAGEAGPRGLAQGPAPGTRRHERPRCLVRGGGPAGPGRGLALGHPRGQRTPGAAVHPRARGLAYSWVVPSSRPSGTGVHLIRAHPPARQPGTPRLHPIHVHPQGPETCPARPSPALRRSLLGKPCQTKALCGPSRQGRMSGGRGARGNGPWVHGRA